MPASVDTLRWALLEIKELSKRPQTLTKGHRIGSLALSMLVETTAYTACVSPMAHYMSKKPQLNGFQWSVTAGFVFGVCLALAALVGFLFRGGPVFRIMGIEVCHPNGRPASRLRCAWRNSVAWSLFFLTLILGWYTGMIPILSRSQSYIVSLEMVVGLILVVFVVDAIRNPDRASQDVISGTCLVPN